MMKWHALINKLYRPLAVVVMIGVVTYNYLLAPFFGLTRVDPPDGFWTLASATLGVGLGGHALENVVTNFKSKDTNNAPME